MAETPRYRTTFFRLLGFLRPYKWSLAVSVVLAVGTQAAAIVAAYLTGDALAHVIESNDREALWRLVFALLAVGLARALFMVGRRLISGRQALGVEFDMRNQLYAKLLRLSFRFYDSHQTGQLMSRATVDLQSVRFFLGYGLIFFFQHVLTVVGVITVMLVFSWKLALVACAITPVLIMLAYRYSSISHPVLRDVQQKMADMTTVAEENIVGVHVVKSFAQEANELEKFSSRSNRVFARSMDANRQRAIYVPLLSFLPLLAQAGVILVGGRMVVQGNLSLTNFFFFNALVLMLVFPLRMLGMWIGQAQRATASGERIFEVLDEIEDVADKPGAVDLPPGPGRVTFEQVSFEYADGRPVLEGIDLELEPGKAVALIGHTGSGKTTLASLVPRFYDVTEGRVVVDGVDVRDAKVASLRREIGVVLQDPFLFSATVRENIAFARPDATDEEIERAARLAQADEFIAELPERYDTVIGERGITLSGGQRQRIAIARAILKDPPILLLDEATSALDNESERLVQEALDRLMQGRTTLIIAHRLSTIRAAHRIAVLDDGWLVELGSHDELLAREGLYARLWQLQFADTVAAAPPDGEVLPVAADLVI
jgi:ABC-type multidrug transport system fused ATPase/permease subunit